jgi:large subunit ribosomal protein L29e
MVLLWLNSLFQVDAKFLRNQRFAKKHNLKPEEQKKRAEQRKASKAETV